MKASFKTNKKRIDPKGCGCKDVENRENLGGREDLGLRENMAT